MRIAQAVAHRLSVPWMLLHVSEGSVWGYVLFAADGTCLDEFCVSPGHWDSDRTSMERLRGKPGVLADVWDVPIANVERYLVDWQRREINEDEFEYALRGRGKAYDADKHAYGDIWQVFDFLKALGGKDPVNLLAGARQHVITLSPA